MFGHGEESEWEGLFMRVLVSSWATAEGIAAFVTEILERYNRYPVRQRYREEEITSEYNKFYLRPGRKRKADKR